mmetsp:Transcript_20977/g.45648  ORF Transcript_20977/g.45648 Transcript_20977/m.45648 type:complete len:275 (-) Transcript_20977:850-1674(-)
MNLEPTASRDKAITHRPKNGVLRNLFSIVSSSRNNHHNPKLANGASRILPNPPSLEESQRFKSTNTKVSSHHKCNNSGTKKQADGNCHQRQATKNLIPRLPNNHGVCQSLPNSSSSLGITQILAINNKHPSHRGKKRKGNHLMPFHQVLQVMLEIGALRRRLRALTLNNMGMINSVDRRPRNRPRLNNDHQWSQVFRAAIDRRNSSNHQEDLNICKDNIHRSHMVITTQVALRDRDNTVVKLLTEGVILLRDSLSHSLGIPGKLLPRGLKQVRR